MTIYLLRASHANQFELQNYEPLAKELDIRVVTSRHPLTQITLPTVRLWSPTDLPPFPFRRQLLNRLIGGEQWLLGLEKYIKEQRYYVSKHSNKGERDEVVVHTAETYTPYTHQAVELKKRGMIKRLVCTCWETIPHNNEKFVRLRAWKQEAYRYVDIFHTPTARAKQALIAEGVTPEKIVVIPYGVDVERFRPMRRKKNKQPVILTVARLQKEKGMEVLEQVARALPRYEFRIIGKGPYIPRGSNITVKAVDYTHIHKEYQKADLFFFPSQSSKTWEEQYGMAIVEAMACDLPLVTSDRGAIPEVVGEIGVIIKEQDIKGYIKAITAGVRGGGSKVGERRSHALRYYDSSKVATRLQRLYT